MNAKDGERKTDKLFNFRPVFFAALFLCLGIFFYFQYHFNDVSALWLLCLIPLAVTSFFFCRTSEKWLRTAFSVALLGIFFFVGFFGFSLQVTKFYDREEWLGENYVSGRVVEKRPYESQIGLVLDDLMIGGEKAEGKLVAYLPTSFVFLHYYYTIFFLK